MVKEFDWRNRHGANDPASPYYDGDVLGTDQRAGKERGGGAANRFPGERNVVYTLYNSRHRTVSGDVLAIDPRDAAEVFDAWRDAGEQGLRIGLGEGVEVELLQAREGELVARGDQQEAAGWTEQRLDLVPIDGVVHQ